MRYLGLAGEVAPFQFGWEVIHEDAGIEETVRFRTRDQARHLANTIRQNGGVVKRVMPFGSMFTA